MLLNCWQRWWGNAGTRAGRAPKRTNRLRAGVVFSSVLLVCLGALDLYRAFQTPPFRMELPSSPALQTVQEGTVPLSRGTVSLHSIGKPRNKKRRVFWDKNASLLLNPIQATVIGDWEWNDSLRGQKKTTLPHRVFWTVKSETLPLDFKIIARVSHTAVVSQWWQMPNANIAGIASLQTSRVGADVAFPSDAQEGSVLLGVAQMGEAITLAQVPLPGHIDTRFGTRDFVVSEHLPQFLPPTQGNLVLAMTLPDLPHDLHTNLPLYAYKIYAVDWWGNAEPANGWSTTSDNKEVVVSWANRSAASVRSVRLVVAPYHWFDWQKIPLDWRGARTALPLLSTPPDLRNRGTRHTSQLLLAVNAREAASVQIVEPVAGKINVAAGAVSGSEGSVPGAAFTTYVPYQLLQVGQLHASVYDNYMGESTSPGYTHQIDYDKNGLACLEWRFPGARQENVDSFTLSLKPRYR